MTHLPLTWILGAVLWGCGDHAPETTAKPQVPVVQIQVAIAHRQEIAEKVTAYGTVVPAPGAALTISRPFETRVARLLVTTGQRVTAGDALVHLDPSPDTRLRVETAQRTLDAANRNLETAKRRLDLGLATALDVSNAQQAAEQARAETKSLGARGARGSGTVSATRSGLVANVHVQEGALVPAGSPLIDITAENAMEARVGIELARASQVKAGDAVAIAPVSRREAGTAEGHVRSLSHAVEPTTRLITVSVPLPEAQFLLGEYVVATFPIARHEGLIVPRSAVLPEGDTYVLFTVEQGKAKRHTVRVGVEAAGTIEVIAPELRDGDRVISVGNYGCTDGASVREVAR